MNRIEEIKQRLELITGGIWEYDKHQEQLLARFGESHDELILIGELIDRDDADFFIKAKSDIEYLLERVELYEKALEFYADKYNFTLERGDFGKADYIVEWTDQNQLKEIGHIAREALEGSK
jgi:hypothetical protein